MANGKSYGVTFPFRDSFDGKYLDTTDFEDDEKDDFAILHFYSR